MLKKILISIVILLLIGLGVWKIFFNQESISDKIKNVSENLDSYNLEANMELINGEEKRDFTVKVSYSKVDNEDYFRVSLYDKNINQEQIMLRNQQGVYVLTPSLNQAYNFKSGWPLNSAKPYIYQSLLDVFNGDYDIEKLDDGFVVTSQISFKNSPAYSKQEVKFSNDKRVRENAPFYFLNILSDSMSSSNRAFSFPRFSGSLGREKVHTSHSGNNSW